MPSITFVTNCWEKDWDILLKTRFLKNKIDRNNYQFTKKALVINNVKNRSKVEEYAKKAVVDGVITSYYFVADFIKEALAYFQLSKESLGKGYNYSNHELVSVYTCDTDYLLFYTSDTTLNQKLSWIPLALAEMEKSSNYKVANPIWNDKVDEAKKESSCEIENFYVGYGFSDQCFLVRTKDFRAPIYNEENPASARYPEYGGDTFEKRVDSWMRNHNYLRLTYKYGSYFHEDFDRRFMRKRISRISGEYDQ
jgi:hypothetical protein